MRYAILAFTLAAASIPAIVPGGGPQPLLDFADAFDKAQLTKDAAALDTMIDDHLVYIDGKGQRFSKQMFIEGWTAPTDRFDPIILIDRTVVMLGPDAGVVSAETTLTGTSAGTAFASHIRYADTFRREAGRWHAVQIQVTRMP